MTKEEQSFGPDELVLRRVHVTAYQDGAPTPLTRGAFTPNENDTDGLSLYRASEVSPEELKHAGQKPPEEYLVVAVSVRDLHDLGLSVVPKKADGPPGHCVIPEFTHQAYCDKLQKKERWVPVQEKLRRIAKRVDQSPPLQSG